MKILLLVMISLSLWAEAVPGSIVKFEVSSLEMPKAYMGKKPLMVLKVDKNRYEISVGIGLKADIKKDILIKVHTSYGLKMHTIKLHSKAYKTQYITIDKKKVTPKKYDMDRIWSEIKRSKKALALYTPQKFLILKMQKPVNSTISDDFGKRRFFNKKPKNPHSGVDMKGKIGTPIVSPLAGTVVEMGEFFFNGNVIFIDHGLGLVTMYCHTSEFSVKIGQEVQKGQLIGKVGATGRVTGPHLHWGVSLNGNMVDPRLFF